MTKKKGKGKANKDKDDAPKQESTATTSSSEKKSEQKVEEKSGGGKGKKSQDPKAAGDASSHFSVEKTEEVRPSTSRERRGKKDILPAEVKESGPEERGKGRGSEEQFTQPKGPGKKTEGQSQSSLPPGFSRPAERGKGKGVEQSTQPEGSWRKMEKTPERTQSSLPPGFSRPEERGKGRGPEEQFTQPKGPWKKTEGQSQSSLPPGFSRPAERGKGKGVEQSTPERTQSSLPPGFSRPEERGKGRGPEEQFTQPKGPWKKPEGQSQSSLPPGFSRPAERGKGRGADEQSTQPEGSWRKMEKTPEPTQSSLPPGFSRPVEKGKGRGGDKGSGRGRPTESHRGPTSSLSPEPEPFRKVSPDEKLKFEDKTSKAAQKVTKESGSSDLQAKTDYLAEKLKIQLNFTALSDRKLAAGTRGRRTRIEVNYLEMKLSKLKGIGFHYDFEVKLTKSKSPDKEPPKRLIQPAYDEFKKKYFPNRFPAFDFRKNVYTSAPLFDGTIKEDILNIEDAESTRPCELKIKLELVQRIDLTAIERYINREELERPQNAIQCLDVVFRNAPSLSFTKVGRSFFTKPRQMIPLTGGMELWNGIFQSAVLGEKAFLNVDVAHKAFPVAQSVINLILEFHNIPREGTAEQILNSTLNRYKIEDIKNAIKGLKVKYEIPNKATTKRTVRVLDIIPEPASAITFKLQDGRTTTVQRYFAEEKNYRLKYPNMPCLHIGSPNNKVYVPAELCEIIAGQVTNKKLTDIQTSNMIRRTATPAYERKEKILSTVRQLNINECPALREFGVQVSTDFTKVDARVLEAPNLRYGVREPVKPFGGQWRASRFLQTSDILRWNILNLDNRTDPRSLNNFQQQLKESASRLGIRVENSQRPASLELRNGRAIRDFFKFCVDEKIQLLFVVLPFFKTSEAYCEVKRLAEIEYGVLTQCIKANTMSRMSPSTINNILLKVNAKLNGVNHVLGTVPPIFRQQRCMVVGADVTHPSPEQKKQFPSVVGVTASCDLTATRYNICWRLQNPAVEIIEDMEQIMVEQIKFYQRETGHYPESILFFRDGVSEGQFAQVKHGEIEKIKKAFLRIERNYQPTLTFLVVQKRHHTRFFPLSREDTDNKGNVLPGTCVDTLITYPSKLDFYLCSHSSLQGVSRPTRYCVLENQHDFNSDDIEELTYYLCHLFTRCTRSVSYPAPTYYAHLAAFRARNYLTRDINMAELRAEEKRLTIKPNISHGSPMFFV